MDLDAVLLKAEDRVRHGILQQLKADLLPCRAVRVRAQGHGGERHVHVSGNLDVLADRRGYDAEGLGDPGSWPVPTSGRRPIRSSSAGCPRSTWTRATPDQSPLRSPPSEGRAAAGFQRRGDKGAITFPRVAAPFVISC